MNRIKHEEVKTWAKWEELLDRLESEANQCEQRGQWIYRGQSCANHGLLTSLERACHRWRCYDYSEVEKKIIREFKRRYQQYVSHMPAKDDYFEWLSIMQHYGAPTRHLDWTYSAYVAAYFALEKGGAKDGGCKIKECNEKENDCGFAVVWALESNWCMKKISQQLGLNDKDRYDIDRTDGYSQALMDKVFSKPTCSPGVAVINPYNLLERLSLQQGAFTIPTDISKSFEDNLKVTFEDSLEGKLGSKNKIIKIIIPRDVEVAREFFSKLNRMNVNSATLFPGLDGFAQSLKVSTRFFHR